MSRRTDRVGEAIQELVAFEAQPSRYVPRRNAAQDALSRLAARAARMSC